MATFSFCSIVAIGACEEKSLELLPSRVDAGASITGCQPVARAGLAPPIAYGAALQRSLYFFEAQRLGKLPVNQRVTWRGDALLDDGADEGRDLTGGFQDGANAYKNTASIAYTAAMLAWGRLSFEQGFRDSCQLPFIDETILGAAEYLSRAFVEDVPSAPELYASVGDPKIESSGEMWMSPEVRNQMGKRPSARVTVDVPGPDIAGHTAAALAAASIVERRRGNVIRADDWLARADRVFDFGDRHRGVASDPDRNGNTALRADGTIDKNTLYRSAGVDKLLWAAAWLHVAHEAKAKNEGQTWLTRALALLDETAALPDTVIHWRNQTMFILNKGAAVLLAIATSHPRFIQIAQDHLDWWTIGLTDMVMMTPGGLAWRSVNGKAGPEAATTAFLALVYGNWVSPEVCRSTRPKTPTHMEGRCGETYLAFARRNTDYLLGNNPAQRSYMIGFGNNSVLRPRHAAAMGAFAGASHFSEPALAINRWRHVLFGGVVGGPDVNDNWMEVPPGTQPPTPTHEATLEFVAPFPGLLAGLYERYGGLPDTLFPGPETRDDELVVRAVANATGTDIAVTVENRSAWPARVINNFSVRYFVRLEPGIDPSSVTVEPKESDCESGAVATSLRLRRNDIYFVEIHCTRAPLFPGGLDHATKRIRFSIAAPSGWSPVNDPSFTGLPISGSPGATDRIVLYDDGRRISGQEP